jgi:ribonuclease-3
MFENFRASMESQPSPGPEHKEIIEALEQLIGVSIDEPLLFIRALRHRSTLSDQRYHPNDSYERLEFLGDAVLELIVSEFIFDHFPQKNEGFLTQMRAKLVKGETLAMYASKMGLSELIIVGNRSQEQGIKYSESTLSDVFESLLGAIYITKGYRAAMVFVRGAIEKYMDLSELSDKSENYKSILLEYAQARSMAIPRYEVIKESGPDHNKTFQIKVLVDEKEQGQGAGKSKKEAEQKAAHQALQKLENTHSHSAFEGG